MRRRGVLAALGAAVTLAGCSGLGETEEPAERVTPAPVPTDRPMPQEGPPVDLSELGVGDAAELGERHQNALVSEAHGFTREATVFEEGEPIRTLRVVFRARSGAGAYHFVFETEDTPRYPEIPAEPYFEVWDDGTTHQRSGRDDPEFLVSSGRLFDSPGTRTTDRFRIQRLFEALQSGEVTAAAGRFEFVGSGLRTGRPVAPERLRAVSDPREATLEATGGREPLYVGGYDLSLSAAVSGRPVEVRASVEYERLADAPLAPSWVSTAREKRA